VADQGVMIAELQEGHDHIKDPRRYLQSFTELSCLPYMVNGRCLFGANGVEAFRFENATFFNDDVEFNWNVGFDEDALCMPIYNATAQTCVYNSNFTFLGGNVEFDASPVTFRDEVWFRENDVTFRGAETTFDGQG
jgi:hypothetical protein